MGVRNIQEYNISCNKRGGGRRVFIMTMNLKGKMFWMFAMDLEVTLD